MLVLKNIFNFIAKYNIQIHIERCSYRDGFIITAYRYGCYRSNFIGDAELLIADEDYLLFVVKGMVHELLEEEQRHLKVTEQFKKSNITVEIKNEV
jgi:hypothetical protein